MEKGTEGHSEQEPQPQPYYLASRFKTRQQAAVPYYAAQETIRTTDCELSAYRFMQQWDRASEKPWYIIVIGEKPADAIQQRLANVFSMGEIATVPQEALEIFLIRRLTETAKGTWTEGHHGESGLQVRRIKFSRRPKGKGYRRRKCTGPTNLETKWASSFKRLSLPLSFKREPEAGIPKRNGPAWS